MTDATELDEAGIRARLEAATPGPWVVFDMDDAEKRKDEPLNEPGQGWYWVWSEPRLPYYGAVLEPERDHPAAIGSAAINDSEGGAQEQADAEFIAHARTDIERLLAALDEARTKIHRLTEISVEVTQERDEARAEVERWRKRMRATVNERAVWKHDLGEHAGDLPFMPCPSCERDVHAARAEAAESALAAAEQERDEAATALTLQRHETSLVREARGEAMAEVEHWRALAERAWDEAVASAYLHETENWTGIKHADNPYRAALATPTTPEETQP